MYVEIRQNILDADRITTIKVVFLLLKFTLTKLIPTRDWQMVKLL